MAQYENNLILRCSSGLCGVSFRGNVPWNETFYSTTANVWDAFRTKVKATDRKTVRKAEEDLSMGVVCHVFAVHK